MFKRHLSLFVKPFEPDELLQKINRTLSYKTEVSTLKESIAYSNKMAFTAMTVSSELGEVIRIMEEMFLASQFADLSEKFFQWSDNMELNSCIRIKASDFESCLSNKVPSTPIERELIEILATKGRIFSFDSRTQFNGSQVQILIKNMPTDDETKYGRLIDTLPVLLVGIDKCVARIYELNLKEQHQKNLEETIHKIKAISNTTSETFANMQQDIRQVFNEFQSKLDWEIPRMGLEEDQEKLIMKLSDDCMVKSRTATNVGIMIKDDLAEILRLLREVS